MPTLNNFKSLEELSKLDYITETHIQGIMGDINNPLLNLPLKNNLDMICGDGSVTFTRSTTGTYIDRYGVVKSAAINAPRFEKEGLLIEGDSTNLLTYSEQFDNSVWSKTRSSISANATTAPDGTTTADGLIANTDNSSHFISYWSVLSADKTYTYSQFLKPGNKNWVRIIAYSWDSSWSETGRHIVYFNISNGDIGLTYTTTYTNCSYKIKKLTNGWYRCSITFTVPSGTDLTHNCVRVQIVDSNYNLLFAGDGSTINTYLWGAQLEELPFATSYIPTTTAAVTRTAEVCRISGNNVPSYVDKSMTIICDADILGKVSSGSQTLWRNDWSIRNIFCIDINNNVTLFRGNSTNTTVPYYPENNISYRYAGVIDIDENKRKMFINGELVDSTTFINEDSNYRDYLYIGCMGTFFSLFGHISNFRIYDIGFSDNEIKLF